MGLRTSDLATWDRFRVAKEMQARIDALTAIRHECGGSFDNAPPEKAAQVKELLHDLNLLEARHAEATGGIDESFDHFDKLLNTPADGEDHPGHGRTTGAGGSSIRPVASMWDAMNKQGFRPGSNPRVTVPAGVLWAAVTSPTDTLAPADRARVAMMGKDERWIFPALLSDPLSPLATAVDWARQSVRALASTATMRRTIAATSTKPESAFTVVLVHSALEQIAHKIAGIPNIVFRNPSIRTVIDSELRLGLGEALDAQAVAIIGAAGMTAGGTGSTLAARIRKAMTVVQAAGFQPDTVALSPADAEALDLELLDILNSTNTLPNWGLRIRVGKSVTTGFVFDSSAFATVHASPVDVAVFEENAGASNSQLARAEFNAITTVEQVAAGAALGAAA